MKYIVVKALLGFGDRLESLKMCVDYAIQHDLKIIIDWSDITWCHNSESFYKYFSLDMPTIDLEELQELEQLEDLKVYPEYWKGKLTTKLDHTILKNPTSELSQLLKPYDADIIVCTCSNIRNLYPDSSFFYNKFKVIDPRVIEEVKKRQNMYNLSECWGIHLRGTDRATGLEYKENRVTAIVTRLVGYGFFSAKCVIVSDDEEYVMIWKRRWGHQHPILTSFTLGGNQGSHRVIEPGVEKDLLNVNLLIDFFTLASCSRIFTTARDSRFAREATHVTPLIKRILN
jgi:hypothetical protein